MKKLQLCMKTYDYKDEQKDVKGKVTTVPPRQRNPLIPRFPFLTD